MNKELWGSIRHHAWAITLALFGAVDKHYGYPPFGQRRSKE